MNIRTDLVKNKQYSQPIQSELCKYSQEYRVLATLRYLFPQKYGTMIHGEAPDLQDCKNDIGVEVTVATKENEMEANSVFSKRKQGRSKKEIEKYDRIIELSGYLIETLPGNKLAISTTGTADGEKTTFQKSIKGKGKKLSQYRAKFKEVGLAVINDLLTKEAENHLVDWLREVVREDSNSFDFFYVVSDRFCIYYDTRTNCSRKREISDEVTRLLRIIGRMTAEGELSLDSQEWQ